VEITYQLHIQDIVNVLAYEDLRDVILVGHSYGGPLVLMVAEHACARVAQLICLATAIPANGQTFKETFPEVWQRFHQLALAHGVHGGFHFHPGGRLA
jgi:pimeloyl-ACP methyl ester carboxylesterase